MWWLFVTWLPTFLKEQFAFDIKQIGAFAWFPYLLAAMGSLIGGYYSSRQIKKGVNAVVAKRNAVTIGCVIMLASLVTIVFILNSLKEQPEITIGLISITLFGFHFLIGNIQTLPSDFF